MGGKRKRTLMSWSSGKDSAWSLYLLQKRPDIELVGMFTTINEAYQRVTMHAVRLDLVQRQAAATSLPLQVIEIPDPCSDEQYRQIMGRFTEKVLEQQVECIGFGDLYLETVREYREKRLEGTGIKPLFPLWKKPTDQLAREMMEGGLRTVVTSVDLKQLPASFAGREFDLSMLNDLPPTADPCGENGEFHTCVLDGPMFAYAVEATVGERVERDGFAFADLILGSKPSS